MSDPDTTAARVFVAEATSSFRFLSAEYTFEGPFVDDGPFAVWMVFKGLATGVEVAYDTRDDLVETFLVRLVNGDLPPYDETEETHYVGTESLAPLERAQDRWLADANLTDRTHDDFRRVLGSAPGVVGEFGDVLRGDFRRFDQAIAERTAWIENDEQEYRRELAEEAAARSAKGFARWFRRRRPS